MRAAIIFYTFFFLLSGYSCKGQEKIKFTSMNYAGFLYGKGIVGQFHSVNDLQKKNWFAGAGVGIDYDHYRTIPFYFSLTRFLANPKIPLFFSVDIGTNYPWENKSLRYIQSPGDYRQSLFWAGGLGYSWRIKNSESKLLVNLGYSYKHLILDKVQVICPFIGPCFQNKERYDYKLNRLSIKAGWMF